MCPYLCAKSTLETRIEMELILWFLTDLKSLNFIGSLKFAIF